MGVVTLILCLNCASVIGQQHPAFAPWIGPRAREAQDVPDLVGNALGNQNLGAPLFRRFWPFLRAHIEGGGGTETQPNISVVTPLCVKL